MRDYEVERAQPATERRAQPETATADRAPWSHAPDAHHLDAHGVMTLQRTAGNAAVVQLLRADDGEPSPLAGVVGSGGGAPLDAGLRTSMESAFGTSFGDVRVHTDGGASQSAEAVGANAYTVGSDIVFRQGQFDPSTAAGQKTIAHELTHVVQQRSGPVDGTPTAGGYSVSDPGDRFEQAASATASEIVDGTAASGPAVGGAAASGPTAQREMPEEDEEQPR